MKYHLSYCTAPKTCSRKYQSDVPTDRLPVATRESAVITAPGTLIVVTWFREPCVGGGNPILEAEPDMNAARDCSGRHSAKPFKRPQLDSVAVHSPLVPISYSVARANVPFRFRPS